MNFYCLLEKTPSELTEGLNALKEEYPISIGTENQEGMELIFKKTEDGSEINNYVRVTDNQAHIQYKQVSDAFRALGRLLGEMLEGHFEIEFQERANFKRLGAMIDCSRNGVMRIEYLKSWLQKMALMGFNVLMLYTEDTYEVPDEPYFGYLRGRYTSDELKELDNYASSLGIEMLPCIQTLGHLMQVLKWPAYNEVRDTEDIFLVGEEKTYTLLEKMITAVSSCFRSNRIHVGMDEAHALGMGKYKRLHGERSRFDIMNDHLARVGEICKKHDLQPMIWSDMYFRIASEADDYYDLESVIPEDVIKKIPEEVDLVYWDYSHTDPDFYAEWIERHRALGHKPIVALGAWTWRHFWAALKFASATLEPGMQACKDKGIEEILLTLWGDDGAECDIDSALPALQLCAEHRFAEKLDTDILHRNFKAICDSNFDNCLKASELDAIPDLVDSHKDAPNTSKWLLWDDPLLGMWQTQLKDFPIENHYENLSKELLSMAKQTKKMSQSFLHAAQLANVLSIKCGLRKKLIKAYREKDLDKLSEFSQEIQLLQSEVKKLWHSHRALWMRKYKPFGWEVMDLRYGGLMARIDTLKDKVDGVIKGKYSSVPEFETELLPVFPDSEKLLLWIPYQRLVTPSVVI